MASMQPPQTSCRTYLRLAAGVVLLILASTFGIAIASGFAAGDARGVGVVFAPGVTADEALRRVLAAGAMPMRAGAASNVAIAWVDGPGTVAGLYRAGAWLVIGGAVAPGCAPGPDGVRSPT
jgi:hypothetical protein